MVLFKTPGILPLIHEETSMTNSTKMTSCEIKSDEDILISKS